MNVDIEPAGTHDRQGNPFTVWQMAGGTRQQLLMILESMGAALVLFRANTLQLKGGYRARFTAYDANGVCISGQLDGIEARHFKDRDIDKFTPPPNEQEIQDSIQQMADDADDAHILKSLQVTH